MVKEELALKDSQLSDLSSKSHVLTGRVKLLEAEVNRLLAAELLPNPQPQHPGTTSNCHHCALLVKEVALIKEQLNKLTVSLTHPAPTHPAPPPTVPMPVSSSHIPQCSQAGYPPQAGYPSQQGSPLQNTRYETWPVYPPQQTSVYLPYPIPGYTPAPGSRPGHVPQQATGFPPHPHHHPHPEYPPFSGSRPGQEPSNPPSILAAPSPPHHNLPPQPNAEPHVPQVHPLPHVLSEVQRKLMALAGLSPQQSPLQSTKKYPHQQKQHLLPPVHHQQHHHQPRPLPLMSINVPFPHHLRSHPRVRTQHPRIPRNQLKRHPPAQSNPNPILKNLHHLNY